MVYPGDIILADPDGIIAIQSKHFKTPLRYSGTGFAFHAL